ncbi:oligosaccharide flippase family protein [Streptococcus hongkongensis]|nr:capsid assembly protein [Streptococcus uberis]
MDVKKLFQSGLIYTVGNLLIQGLAFITLPIYTRLISVEVFGQYSLYVSWVGIISLFIGLQTSGSLSSGKTIYKEEFDNFSSSALMISNISFLIFFVISYLFRSFFSKLLGFSELVFVLLIVQSFTNYIFNFFGQYFIQLQKSFFNFILSLLNALFSVGLTLSFLFFSENDFYSRIFGALIPNIIVAAIAIFYIYQHSSVPFKTKYFYFIISISIPLIFHLFGHQVLNQLDRIMLASYKGTREVALYSFGYSLGMLIQIVLNSINTAWVPWYFEAKKNKDTNLSTYVKNYQYLGVLITLGYLTIFPELAIILGGKNYAGTIDFISIIIVSYFLVFLYTFPVNVQFYHANTVWIPIGTLIAAFFNWAINIYLIPHYSSFGAAVATLLSYSILLVFHHIISKIKYNYHEVNARDYITLISIVICYALVMNVLIKIPVLRFFIGFLILLGYYIINKKTISYYIKKLKRST